MAAPTCHKCGGPAAKFGTWTHALANLDGISILVYCMGCGAVQGVVAKGMFESLLQKLTRLLRGR